MATTLKRPGKLFSFSDWAKQRPNAPAPGDALDSQFFEIIKAISDLQDAVRDVRRDDGTPVISPALTAMQTGIVDTLAARLGPLAQEVVNQANRAGASEQNAQLFAEDAEAAARVAGQLSSGMIELRKHVEERIAHLETRSDSVDMFATSSEDWANYAKAQSDNAIAAKNESLQWAEYLAGPVVDTASAPSYIADSPFPHGLYYQPVEGAPGGLWSAKWWALYAEQLVGKAGFYYLGGYSYPPVPGSINPSTGERIPSPLAPGSVYYDTVTKQLMVWDGSQWTSPTSLTPAYKGHFIYTATANQSVFSGADMNAATPVVGVCPSEVYVNGVRLAPADFTVNSSTNTLTIADPLAANSIVQWDLLVPPGSLAPGSINAFKIHTLTPDGLATTFTLQYTDGVGATQDANVGDGAQLLVSLDGIVQESGADYTASGSSLHMVVAPPADAHFWAVWYQPGAPAP